jgi:squalene-associated FAD-dependent desaturase
MPEPTHAALPVVVVGGGWAGLSGAVTLCTRKVPVLLLEAARQLGGRARSVRIGEQVYDNGQHLMVGAYESVLTLMQQVGIDVDAAFERLPLTLQLYRGKKLSLRLRAPRLPAPLHLLVALVGARGLSVNEQFRAIRFGRRLLRLDIRPGDDISVQALLHSQAQTPGLIRKLWDPLCIAMLNTPANLASARLFVRALQIAFGGLNRHSDLLLARRELSALLPTPCTDFLERQGAHLELGQRVTDLAIDDRGVQSVHIGNRVIPCQHLILATPHVISRRLLSRHPALQALADQLSGLGHEPVTTVYLQYPPATRLPFPLVGLENSITQWVFDRRVCNQPGLMAVVISARGEHQHLPTAELVDRVAAELAASFRRWPTPQHSQVLREKRATFCARVGVDAIRPANRTPVNGLWLAGDYTATGLPATLESAVRSGRSAAEAVIEAIAQ